MITLYTDRMIITEHNSDDLEEHHKLLSDKKVMRFLPDIMTETLTESKKDLDLAIEKIGEDDRLFYYFAMKDKETKELIGEIGYTVNEFTEIGKYVGLGYFIHSKYWGKGYTSEAVKALMEFAFTENHVYKISTGCLKENPASEKVMIKCGLIKERELEEHSLHEGVLKDRVEYSITSRQWEGSK